MARQIIVIIIISITILIIIQQQLNTLPEKAPLEHEFPFRVSDVSASFHRQTALSCPGAAMT